jgi:hypothetical protein
MGQWYRRMIRMAKTKEQRIYLEGIAFAYKIAKEQGIEALAKEVEFRGANNCVLNVNYNELVAVTRGRCKDELMYVATASAVTLSEVLKLPPSVMKTYLREFNRKIVEYRLHSEKYIEDSERIQKNVGLTVMSEEYMQEKEEF